MDHPRSLEPQGPSKLRASLEAAGWKFTRQREAVYEQLLALGEHPTAEDVYRGVKAVVPSISLATVYKALETLVDSGLATKLVAIDGPARYDARSDHHYHLRCLRSGFVEDLPTEYDPDLIAKIDPGLAPKLQGRGFRVTGYRLELVGYFEEPGVDPDESAHP
jgi:Fur family peroxide stress response transcriptional regulator